MRRWWLVLMFLLALSPAAAQDERLIVEGNLQGEATFRLNPLYCFDPVCRRMTDVLFPSLLRVDRETGRFAPATLNEGLAASWELNGDQAVYHLRADRMWSDGVPVTAYDVYFSYRALVAESITAYAPLLRRLVASATVLDEDSIAFSLNEAGCTTTDQLNFPVIPAHVFVPGFTQQADLDAFDFLTAPDPLAGTPPVTGGPFTFYERLYGEAIHLLSRDGATAYAYVDVASPDEQVNRFLRGELNLLVEPPYERRHDLRAANDVSLTTLPGNDAFYIGLNLARPTRPQSAFDENGQPLEQAQHPIFGDVAVRRVIQLALDVPALIEAALEGDGTALGGLFAPASSTYDPAHQPVSRDLIEAARLLDSAGWKDVNRDGIRECIDCQYAREFTPLSFTLLYPEFDVARTEGRPAVSYTAIAGLIRQQLRQVGIDAQLSSFADPITLMDGLAQQNFDAFLGRSGDLQTSPLESFLVSEDVLYTGVNVTSFHDAVFEQLVAQANEVSDCDAGTRRDLLWQAQARLVELQPYIWLFSPHRAVATREDTLDLLDQHPEIVP